jgi:hypothetical protein
MLYGRLPTTRRLLRRSIEAVEVELQRVTLVQGEVGHPGELAG